MASLFPPPCPLLPDFESLLVSGAYPASSPIHLSISQAARPVLLISTSQENLTGRLEAFNDQWLDGHAGLGSLSKALSNIQIVYCPTISRWLSLMTALRVSSHSITNEFFGVLDQSPSLIVIHEPSHLVQNGPLLDSENLSTYVQLIDSAISSASFVSTVDCPTKLALFDSGIKDLELPILKSGSDKQKERRSERVLPIIQRYFEWHALCKSLKPPDPFTSSQPDEFDGREFVPTHRLVLERNTSSAETVLEEEPVPIIWEWAEHRVASTSAWTERRPTAFEWKDRPVFLKDSPSAPL